MPDANPRKPRFTRVSDPPNFNLTARDLEIIRHVTRYRLLRSTHVAALVGASQQVVSRRLQLLFHHGYLDRPREQFLLGRLTGNQHIVYAPKGRPAKGLFIEHTLVVADLMVALEIACRIRPGVRFIDQEEALSHAQPSKRRHGNPLYYSVAISLAAKRHLFGIVPDRLFGIETTDADGQTRCGYFFLEADRGTMPVERRAWSQTSITRKLLGYSQIWRQGLHQKHFGIPRFRVIIATTNAERAGRIVAQCRKISHGSGLFLVAGMPTGTAPSLLDAVFQTASDTTERLLDGI